jgi:hypothetical protein
MIGEYKDCSYPSCLSARYVRIPIPNHPGFIQIDAVLPSSLPQEIRGGLSAFTNASVARKIAVGMVAAVVILSESNRTATHLLCELLMNVSEIVQSRFPPSLH